MNHNWTYKKLGEVCKTTSGGTPSKDHNEYYEGGTIPWLRSGEVANRNITRTEMFITQEGVDNSSAKLIPQNSVVIAMYGATVGQVGILRIEATTNQAVCSIMPNDSFVPEFLYYALLSHKKAYLGLAVGGAQPNISQQIIKNTTIPLPPLETQSRIVAELDLLQSIIDKQKAQLTELDNLAQAVFYDMFGDPVDNDKGWEVKKLGEVALVKIGPFGSLLHTSDYISGGIPLVNPIHMKNGYIKPDNSFTISEEKKKEMLPYLLKEGDVVFARRGEIGRCAIVSKKEDGFLCGTGSLFVRFTEPINEVYVLYLTKAHSFINNLVSKAKGATMLNINCKIVEDLKITLPPLSLQQSFAAKIESIEKQKAAINQSIAETQKLFNFTMDKYFG